MSKILIIRFSSIGDIVLTTPVLRCIKKQLPDAEIHYLTKQAYSQVIENNPYVDNIFYFENDLRSVINRLKVERYDYIIDLHHNLRTFLVKSLLWRKSFSFNKLNFKKWLLVNFKINVLPKVHIVDRYFDTLKPIGVVNDGLGLDFFIPSQYEIDVKQYLPAEFHNGFTAFVIGAKHNTKCLPSGKIISICKKINQPIVLLGGKEDVEIGEDVALANKPYVFNACGKLSLRQSASVIRQAEKVITHDTGLMHIAAAFQKKIISIWGSTVPDFGMYPYYGSATAGKSDIIEVNGLPCRPCSKIGYDSCPKKHFKCMRDIDEEKIRQLAL
jgi:ADP-heptose:LPS heptosyltransferase